MLPIFSLTVFAKLSAKGALGGGVEVRSCMVSPLSDPRVSPGWSVIRDGCSADSSLTLSNMTHGQEDEEEEEDDEEYYEEEEEVPRGLSFRHPGRALRNKAGLRKREHGGKRGRGGRAKRKESDGGMGGEEDQIHRLRFSFVLRPIYNNSVQFLHCRIRLCGPESVTQGPPTAIIQSGCLNPWGLRIPALVSRLPNQQVQYMFYIQNG